ncbi:embryonic protein DC-8-like [Diospyros lotus]|uniref:embryonic protein DC-8-like n=1 Tax=Diospyros lotus TaxID=55363 RepID=UPI002251E754|nr:embryonic protein DC-8-like [Diospyros lotus]
MREILAFEVKWSRAPVLDVEFSRFVYKGGEVGADTEYEAGRKLQELKLQQEGNEYDDEDRRRAEADWETTANRGTAARSNIYGAKGSVEEAIEEKLTMPTDIVKETRSASEYGGPKRAEVAKVLVDVEETPGRSCNLRPRRRG